MAVYGKQLQLAAFQVFSETSQVSSRLAYESIHKRLLAINDAVCVWVCVCVCVMARGGWVLLKILPPSPTTINQTRLSRRCADLSFFH